MIHTPPPITAPVPHQVTVTNVGAPAIVHVSIWPTEGVPQEINQLSQPLYPGAVQSIVFPAAAECCVQIKAVYADGHTVTVPFWNITTMPTISIHR